MASIGVYGINFQGTTGDETKVGRLFMIAATGNEHKMREFHEIFSEIDGFTADICSEKELASRIGVQYVSPEETGDTFNDNSYIKARALYDFICNNNEALPQGYDLYCVIADDSGICVEALNNAPGVRSARYAALPNQLGNSDDKDNLNKLLADMENVPDGKRRAWFECCITAVIFTTKSIALDPDNPKHIIQETGRLEGELAREPHGEGGFGYDPILFVPSLGKTTAEITPAEKNLISHRGKALRKAANSVYGIFTKMSDI